MHSQRLLLDIELTISFLIGRKRTVNFRNQRLWRHLAADHTIIMSRTLKVTGNHVVYDRFVLLAVNEEAKTCLPFFFSFFFFRSLYNKTIIRFGFSDI